MADIRINALATTAASTASDDFVAVDGSANGTRKLNAYSPTFGGNLTVSGTAGTGKLTVSSANIRLSNTYYLTGNLVAGTEIPLIGRNASDKVAVDPDGYGITTGGAATIGGNLTVSGTGTSSVAGSFVVGQGSSSGVVYFGNPSNNYLFQDGSSFYLRAGGSDRLTVVNSTGNVLIGTTTDNTAKLQVYATPATAGYQYGIRLSDNSTTTIALGLQNIAGSSMPFVYGNSALGFGTNGVTALTLDSSQNATFAGKVTVNGTDGLLVNKSASLSVITMGDGIAGSYSRLNMRTGSAKYAWSIAAQDIADNALTITPSTAVGGTTFTTPVLTVAQSGAVTVSGAIAIGNTVQTAASVASTHKVTISIGGSTYYLLATNV